MFRTRFKLNIVTEFLPPARTGKTQKAIILCDGMPSIPRKQPLAEFLAAKGYWVGLDFSGDDAEYPFQALLRARSPGVRFLHTGVENPSARYYPAGVPEPCAVLCMHCRGNQAKIARYERVGKPIVLERSLLFLKQWGGGGE